MKKQIFYKAALTLGMLLSASAFAENIDQVCGRYVISEDRFEGKPANEYLGADHSTSSWQKYYLKPKGKNQKKLLAAMIEGKNYCVEGNLYWCGRNSEYKCISVMKTTARN